MLLQAFNFHPGYRQRALCLNLHPNDGMTKFKAAG